MQQEYARKFENSDANPRFYEQREIAKLFCIKGYGYPTAREYLGDNMYKIFNIELLIAIIT